MKYPWWAACIVLLFLVVARLPSGSAATLTWTGAQSQEWNTAHTNWSGGQLFNSGDTVTFPAGDIFIGLNGVPTPVSPYRVQTLGNVTFSGGDILTGDFVNESGRLVFTSSAGSLSFPGDIVLRGGTSSLIFDTRNAPDGAALNLGQGSIVLWKGMLGVQAGIGKAVTLNNQIVLENQTSITFRPFTPETNGAIRLMGGLRLNGGVAINTGGTPGPQPDEIGGLIRLDQTATRSLPLFVNGSYSYRTLEISGSIVDGEGPATNGLSVQNYGLFGLRFTGTNNTYRHGTRIFSSPSAPKAAVEVGAGSSLGYGNVKVEGVLRLMGSWNIAHTAAVEIVNGGNVILDPGVKIRLRSLRLGNSHYTSGRFGSNNARPFLSGAGEFRLPETNLPPTLQFTNTFPTTIYAGSDITFQPDVNDPDGQITRVNYLVFNEILLASQTNAPWTYTLSNAAPGHYSIQGYAFDDDGAYRFTSRTFQVVNPPAPRIDNITIHSNHVVLEFEAAPDVRLTLQRSTDLPATTWTNIVLLAPEPVARWIRSTNTLTPESPGVFYRLVAGRRPD